MTVTKEMIMQVSPFSVSDSGDFDETDFEQYKIWAGRELDRVDPGFDTDTYDYCHALLICHFYDISPSEKASIQYKSEKIGDYSYTRSEGGTTIAPTSFYNRFLQVLEKWKGKQATTSTKRDDAEDTYPASEFALDQSNVGVFE